MARLIAVMLMAVIAAPLHALEEVKPFSAEYTVHYNGFKVGEMKQRLERRNDGSYMLETVVHTTGLVSWFKDDRVTERSVWRYVDGDVRPDSYRYHYTGRNEDVVEKMDFNWEKNEAISLKDDKTKVLPISPGVYDKQVYQIAMRHGIDNGVKKFAYDVADRGKIRDYDLEVVGREKVMTPFGEVKTVKVKKGTTTLWLAEKYQYLVVKIEQDEDGNLATSYITKKSP